MAAARATLLRSPPLCAAAARAIAAESLSSPLRTLRPIRSSSAARLLRCPLELGACVETLLPRHSATASAVMTSMLEISRRGHGWLSEAGNDDM